MTLIELLETNNALRSQMTCSSQIMNLAKENQAAFQSASMLSKQINATIKPFIDIRNSAVKLAFDDACLMSHTVESYVRLTNSIASMLPDEAYYYVSDDENAVADIGIDNPNDTERKTDDALRQLAEVNVPEIDDDDIEFITKVIPVLSAFSLNLASLSKDESLTSELRCISAVLLFLCAVALVYQRRHKQQTEGHQPSEFAEHQKSRQSM